jgi:hypothetical protein
VRQAFPACDSATKSDKLNGHRAESRWPVESNSIQKAQSTRSDGLPSFPIRGLLECVAHCDSMDFSRKLKWAANQGKSEELQFDLTTDMPSQLHFVKTGIVHRDQRRRRKV